MSREMVYKTSGLGAATDALRCLDDFNEVYGEFETVEVHMSVESDETDATDDETEIPTTTKSDATATVDAIDDYQDQGITLKVPVPREIIAEAKRRRDTAGRWSDSGEGHLEDYILDHLVTGWSVTPVYGERP